MKQFFLKHSYNMVKMFLNQFAISIFGFVLVLATTQAKNNVLRNFTSVFAILFYLFLLYTMTWEIGFRDKIPSEAGKTRRNPFTGVSISLCANSVNLILAVFILMGQLIQTEVFGNIGATCISIAVLTEGMYAGVIANPINGVLLNQQWFTYFLLPIPAILTCGIAYYLGLRDIKFTKLFNQPYPESDREPNQKKNQK